MSGGGRPVFPFTALVGQTRMKRALVLNTINPRIGGVLIRGEKGTAKSTAVRALASLLPEIAVVAGCQYACDPDAPDAWCDDCQQRAPAPSAPATRKTASRAAAEPSGRGQRGAAPRLAANGGAADVSRRRVPLIELPVGATEDRLVGTLNLERAIQAGERQFEPGLLAGANRGILYVDEVNLLADHLVDVLLDAAAMGTNYVEREGVSVRHPAQFLLVGTMNPEEGDLRPQLLDRFALAVEVEGLRDPTDRAEVVRRRIAFEHDPRGFMDAWAETEAAERERVLAARVQLPAVRLDDRMLGLITQLCCDFEVDGLRADIVMYKTALTLAAYAGKTRVDESDVRDAAELALLHRRRRQPFQQPELDRDRLDERIQEFLDREERESQPKPDSGSGASAPAGADRAGTGDAGTASQSPSSADDGQSDGSARPEQVFGPSRPPTPPTIAAPAPVRPISASRGRRTKAVVMPWHAPAGHSGGYVRSVRPRTPTWRDVALDATLRAAAPHQLARRRARDGVAPSTAGPAVVLVPSDIRQKVRATKLRNLILFVVDASGSMAARDRMAAAKGAVLALLVDAYRKRDQVGLIAFRGRSAELLLPPTNSVDLAEARLRALPTGGRTPLAHGLALALQTLDRHLGHHPDTLPLLVLISDGRANVPLESASAGSRASAILPSPPRRWARPGMVDPLTGIAELGEQLQQRGVAGVVIDSEGGSLRLGMASQLATVLGARYLALGELDAAGLARAVRAVRA